jgi:hypothetical protein
MMGVHADLRVLAFDKGLEGTELNGRPVKEGPWGRKEGNAKRPQR